MNRRLPTCCVCTRFGPVQWRRLWWLSCSARCLRRLRCLARTCGCSSPPALLCTVRCGRWCAWRLCLLWRQAVAAFGACAFLIVSVGRQRRPRGGTLRAAVSPRSRRLWVFLPLLLRRRLIVSLLRLRRLWLSFGVSCRALLLGRCRSSGVLRLRGALLQPCLLTILSCVCLRCLRALTLCWRSTARPLHLGFRRWWRRLDCLLA